jgi:hypothetical protein
MNWWKGAPTNTSVNRLGTHLATTYIIATAVVTLAFELDVSTGVSISRAQVWTWPYFNLTYSIALIPTIVSFIYWVIIIEILTPCCYNIHVFFLVSLNLWWPPLWSSGQSSWLHIQRSGIDSRRYHISWEVVGLERGAFSLVNTIEELLGRKSSGFDLESREYGLGDSPRWPRGTLSPQKLALTSLTNVGRSVGIVRSHTQATEFRFVSLSLWWFWKPFLMYASEYFLVPSVSRDT